MDDDKNTSEFVNSSSTDSISTIKIDPHRIKRRIIQQPVISREDYSFIERIDKLKEESHETHSAFLTFLMDKFFNTKGNYQTKNIIDFMEKMNLRSHSGILRNPWMQKPYGGNNYGMTSCQRTIEHFKQTRKFGCWGGKDFKADCNSKDVCPYHPESGSDIKNKCDLRKGVIWKRNDATSIFQYGSNYSEVVKNQLLHNRYMPMEPLLKVFYPQKDYTEELIEKFQSEFHFSDKEMNILFEI